MVKKNKLATPTWILEGFDSEADYDKSKGVKKTKKKKEKTFKIRECPKCKSDDVGIVTGKECKSGECEWECHKCKWNGVDIVEKELTEKELMKYMDEKGEDIA